MLTQARHKLSLSIFRIFKSCYQRLCLTKGKPELTCFLAGHQRSGTNMVMDVVEKHLKTDVYHETDDRAFDNYGMREIPVIQALKANTNGQVFMVKALCELDLLDGLMNEFSPCKTIWVIRHYHDVVNSMVRSFSTSAKYYKAIKDDRSSGKWRSRNLSDENYQLIQELVTEDISEASAAALQWAIRNLIFFEKNYPNNANVMLVNYEQLVSKPSEIFPEIYQFIGLANDEKSYSQVFSSSIGKNDVPEISPEILKLCEHVWQRFLNI